MKICWLEIINNILEIKILYCSMKYKTARKMFEPIRNQTLMKKFYRWQLDLKLFIERYVSENFAKPPRRMQEIFKAVFCEVAWKNK